MDSRAEFEVSSKSSRAAQYHNTQRPRFRHLTSASPGSKWFTAIQRNDCKTLLQLLEVHPKLGLQTGPDGRSVLHVAIVQGCTELVHKLHKYQALLS